MAARSSKFNEGKAVDAVIRCIEARERWQRGDDGRSPEAERHAAPVEFVCTIGGRLFAFEHTGIEPFPRQIEEQEHARSLFGPIAERVAGALPTEESIQLHVPVGATAGLKRRQIATIQDALVTWVRGTAPTLPIAPYGRYVTPVKKVMLPGVPFPVSLHRIAAASPALRGRFDILHLAPEDIESARVDRIRKVCEEKYPKLAAWRRDARTVLVLENGDIQLSNAQLVYEALVRAEEGRADRPDEIYLVDAAIENPWWVTCLRREGKTYYDQGERFWEIDPNTLTPLTGR
jgi:hypothetical protein